MKAQILRKLAVNPQRDILDSFEIRQGELVTRLHRAQLAIGMSLMSGGHPGAH